MTLLSIRKKTIDYQWLKQMVRKAVGRRFNPAWCTLRNKYLRHPTFSLPLMKSLMKFLSYSNPIFGIHTVELAFEQQSSYNVIFYIIGIAFKTLCHD
jgi:hypothetical protein